MRWLPAPGRRPPIAVVALLVATVVPLADALRGGPLLDTPGPVLAAAAAGVVAGLWLRPAAVAAACTLGAAALTAANQIAAPGEYSVANDSFFFLVVLGGAAVFGVLLRDRNAQVRRLRELSARRAEQRAAEVAAAGIDEHNRVTAGVARGLMQRVGALVVQASGARRESAPAAREAALARIEATSRGALDELRGVLGELRSSDGGTPPTPRPRGPRSPAGPTGGVPAPPLGRVDLLVALSGVPVAFEAVAGAVARGPAWANVVAGVAVGVPLACRRRRPGAAAAAVLALVTLMSAALTPLPETVTVLVPLTILAFALGNHARGWRRVAGVLVLVAGIGVAVVASPPGSRDPEGIVPTIVWMLLAVLAGVVSARRSARARTLGELLAEIEEGRETEVRLAAARQREAIARDLHDSMAHAMTVVCLHAGAAQRRPDDAAAVASAIDTVEETVRAAMEELRHGVAVLAPDHAAPREEPTPTTTTGLAVELRAIATAVDVAATLSLPPSPLRLDGATGRLALRVAREALVNVARHAPSSPARIRLGGGPDQLVVEVSNETPSAPGFGLGSGSGLLGLSELVRESGGHLEYGDCDSAFRVAAHLPVRARAHAMPSGVRPR